MAVCKKVGGSGACTPQNLLTVDAANLSKISAVFVRGKHFRKTALDEVKRQVGESYAKQPANAAEVKAIFHLAETSHID